MKDVKILQLQNKALQKYAADIFVYLLEERGKALSAAL